MAATASNLLPTTPPPPPLSPPSQRQHPQASVSTCSLLPNSPPTSSSSSSSFGFIALNCSGSQTAYPALRQFLLFGDESENKAVCNHPNGPQEQEQEQDNLRNLCRRYLQRLSLRHNELTVFPAAVTQLLALRVLHLDHNTLLELPSAISALRHLTTLSVTHNMLHTLPMSLGNLTELERLMLSDNQLTELPLSLGTMRHLREITLRGNPLTMPPPHVWQQSPSRALPEADHAARVLAYLRLANACNGVGDPPAEDQPGTAKATAQKQVSLRPQVIASDQTWGAAVAATNQPVGERVYGFPRRGVEGDAPVRRLLGMATENNSIVESIKNVCAALRVLVAVARLQEQGGNGDEQASEYGEVETAVGALAASTARYWRAQQPSEIHQSSTAQTFAGVAHDWRELAPALRALLLMRHAKHGSSADTVYGAAVARLAQELRHAATVFARIRRRRMVPPPPATTITLKTTDEHPTPQQVLAKEDK